jgi:hypothetical protein
MRRILGLLGFVGLSSAIASGVIWPDLPKDGYIVGRTATQVDVKAGNAAFAAVGKNGEQLSTPVSLEIPQYAVRVEAGNGKEIPIIVIQAEETPAGKTIGYRMLGSSALGVCMLAEVRLLGRKKPS